jgi:ankyrin repeat protein
MLLTFFLRPLLVCYLCLLGASLMCSSARAASPKDDSPDSHLLESAFSGNLEGVQAALAEGADINTRDDKSGQTALMGSVLRGHVEVVRYFLDKDSGADTSIGEKDGFTPPHGAGFQGRADIMKMLKEAGLSLMDVHKGDGFYPLHRACWGRGERHTETVAYLLGEGIDANLKGGPDSKTCIEMTNNEGTKELLRSYGAQGTVDQGEL